MADVIVIGADEQFSQDAKSVMVNCRTEGRFRGDFALMVPPDYDGEEFTGRGIHVHQVPDRGLYIKMHVFDDCFRRWDRVLALDCDVQVQGPLRRVFGALANITPLSPEWTSCTHYACVANVIYCERRMDLLDYCRALDPRADEHPDIYRLLNVHCLFMGGSVFDPSMMVFRPSAFPRQIPAEIQKVKTILAPANPTCNDVQILNVVLGGLVHRIGQTHFLQHAPEAEPGGPFDYFEHETPETVLLHFGRAHNPRFEKEPGAIGYQTRRCQTPCHEIYQRNLDKFEEVFPR